MKTGRIQLIVFFICTGIIALELFLENAHIFHISIGVVRDKDLYELSYFLSGPLILGLITLLLEIVIKLYGEMTELKEEQKAGKNVDIFYE